MIEQVAVLASAIWLMTMVLKHVMIGADSRVIALGLGIAFGIASVLTGWIDGNPVEVVAQVIIALFAAKLTQDGMIKPVKDLYRTDVAKHDSAD